MMKAYVPRGGCLRGEVQELRSLLLCLPFTAVIMMSFTVIYILFPFVDCS